MPYIAKVARDVLAAPLVAFLGEVKATLSNPGVLNYLITQLVKASLPPVPRYSDYNQAVGVLECVKQEFYRRAAVPYEDAKKETQGDVY